MTGKHGLNRAGVRAIQAYLLLIKRLAIMLQPGSKVEMSR